MISERLGIRRKKVILTLIRPNLDRIKPHHNNKEAIKRARYVTKLNRGRITTVTRFPDCVLITVLINSHLITHSQIDLVDLNQ